jgi:hypothetical protein
MADDHWALTYFDDDEAQALANFVVEVLVLEEAISDALCNFYAVPDRREVFAKQFLHRMTLGNAVERLKPVLDLFNVRKEDRQRLSDVVEMRNTVAHSLPIAASYGDADDNIPVEEFQVWNSKKLGPVRIVDIEPYTVDAFNLRIMITKFPWPTPIET